MANIEFSATGLAKSLTTTAGDDVITVTNLGTDVTAVTHTVSGGAGNDVMVFGGILGVTGASTNYTATANGFVSDTGSNDDTVSVSGGVESFQFTNGTVDFSASVNNQTLMTTALSQNETAGHSWDVENLLTYTGSAISSANGWDLTSIDGSTLTAGNSIILMDGSTVVGAATLSANGQTLEFKPNTAFQATLAVGATASVSFDIVMTKGGVTFTETLTAVVTGTASENADTYAAPASGTSVVSLLDGDDRATGGAGADSIIAGAGADTIYAGASDTSADLFVGNSGADILAGGAGADVLIGGDYVDGTRNDTSTGSDGVNVIYGGDGDDLIAIGGYNSGAAIANTSLIATATGSVGGEAFGGAGNDFILGTASGNDLVGMGDGNDTVVLGSGANTVYAGADDTGTDRVSATSGSNTIYTGAGNDTVEVGAGNNMIGTGDGADRVTVTGGADTVYLGAGDDQVTLLGAGNNTVYLGAGIDTVVAGAATGSQTIYAGTGNATITTGAGSDTIYASTGTNSITSGSGDDVFVFTAESGNATITDFNTGGEDKIDLTAFDLNSVADLAIAVDAGGTTIYLDEDTTITLSTYVTALDANDFIF